MTGIYVTPDASNASAVSGVVDLDNGDATNNVNFGTLAGVVFADNTTPNTQFTIDGLEVQIDSYGGFIGSSGVNQYNDLRGITQNGTIDGESYTAQSVISSISNTSIVLNANRTAGQNSAVPNENETSVIGIYTPFAHINSIDALTTVEINSSIDVAGERHSAETIIGIQAGSISDFQGSVVINANSLSQANVAGYYITGTTDVTDNNYAGSVTVNNTGGTTYGVAFQGSPTATARRQLFGELSTTINVSGDNITGAVLGYTIADTISSKITLTGDAEVGLARGINLGVSTVGNITSDITITGGVAEGIYISNTSEVTGDISGIIDIDAVDAVGINVSYASVSGDITGTIDVTGSGNNVVGIQVNRESGNSSSIASITGANVTVHNSYEGDIRPTTGLKTSSLAALSARIDQVQNITGSTFTSTGVNSATGLELEAEYSTVENVQESGLIDSVVSVRTDNTFYYGDEAMGSMTPTDAYHYKSTVGLDISPSYAGTFDKTDVVLNFGANAHISAYVGAEGGPQAYGDALAYVTQNLTLKGTLPSNGKTTTLIGDIAFTGSEGLDSQTDYLNFAVGTFDISSSHWYVSNVTLGSEVDRSISRVNLKDSTHMYSTDSLNFHVNSVSAHSVLAIEDGKHMTITELDAVNITLAQDLMATETFRITLIDGEMLDALGADIGSKTFAVNLFDIDEYGLVDPNLDVYTIDVIYDGVRYDYRDGLTITMNGAATDLVLERIIPEPSTATLSLLALAGLLGRRRRKS